MLRSGFIQRVRQLLGLERSLKVKAAKVVVSASTERIRQVDLARNDLIEAGNIDALELVEQEEAPPSVEVTLAQEE